MKIFCFMLFFSLLTCILFSQGLVNNGGKLVVGTSGFVIINGGSYTNLTNGANHGAVALNGTVKLTGDWSNNATTGLDLSAYSGTVVLNGTASQTIGGLSAANPSNIFKNITISNNAGAILNNHISISATLQMSSGDFDMQSKNIDLGTTGILNGESNTSRIKVTPVGGANDGRISATRTLIAGLNSNIAGLGIDINSTSYTGAKTISRGHQQLVGEYYGTPYNSALRYFILPGIGQITDANQITSNYFLNELNSITETNLMMYQQVTQSTNTWYSPIISAVNTVPKNVISDPGANSQYLQYIYDHVGAITFQNLIVLGGKPGDHPLPVSLSSFKAKCFDNNIQIHWTTLSEVNNDYFILENSYDGNSWNFVTQISGAGNSNECLNYQYTYNNASVQINYFRIKQVDFNGDFIYSEIIVSDCNEKLIEAGACSFIVQQNNHEIQLSLKAEIGASYKICMIDHLGRILNIREVQISENIEKISFSSVGLAMGVYEIVLFNNKQITTRKIVITSK